MEVQILVTAIGGLTSAVAYMFFQMRQDQKLAYAQLRIDFDNIRKKLDDCEEDRDKLWSELAKLKKEIQNGH